MLSPRFVINFGIRNLSEVHMSPITQRTPRVIIMRHGQTEWSKKGNFTSRTDLPLLKEGAELVAKDGMIGVGPGHLVDPTLIRKIYVSPRLRCHQTMDLFLREHKWSIDAHRIVTEERIREWEYGLYEGWLKHEINADREKKGLQTPFKITRDGCEGGESPQEISDRLDSLIADIREIHRNAIENNDNVSDILIFGHGHSLRMFVLRWLGIPLSQYIPMLMPAGGLGVLSYEHCNVDEPAIEMGFHLSTFENQSLT